MTDAQIVESAVRRTLAYPWLDHSTKYALRIVADEIAKMLAERLKSQKEATNG